jgi:hypothetical protein
MFTRMVWCRLEVKASLSGYPHSANWGYHSIDECVEAWQGMCPLGIHPHEVDPEYLPTPSASQAAFVNTSPRKSAQRGSAPAPSGKAKAGPSGVKRELTPARPREDSAQVLADLYVCLMKTDVALI